MMTEKIRESTATRSRRSLRSADAWREVTDVDGADPVADRLGSAVGR
jgi:hypothetical protein